MKKVVSTEFPEPYLSDPTKFGSAIRAARTASGMTLVDAAMFMQVSKQTLQDLETGTGTVGLGLSMKIAHELGVSLFATPSKDRSRVERLIAEYHQENEDFANTEKVKYPRLNAFRRCSRGI